MRQACLLAAHVRSPRLRPGQFEIQTGDESRRRRTMALDAQTRRPYDGSACRATFVPKGHDERRDDGYGELGCGGCLERSLEVEVPRVDRDVVRGGDDLHRSDDRGDCIAEYPVAAVTKPL